MLQLILLFYVVTSNAYLQKLYGPIPAVEGMDKSQKCRINVVSVQKIAFREVSELGF